MSELELLVMRNVGAIAYVRTRFGNGTYGWDQQVHGRSVAPIIRRLRQQKLIQRTSRNARRNAYVVTAHGSTILASMLGAAE